MTSDIQAVFYSLNFQAGDLVFQVLTAWSRSLLLQVRNGPHFTEVDHEKTCVFFGVQDQTGPAEVGLDHVGNRFDASEVSGWPRARGSPIAPFAATSPRTTRRIVGCRGNFGRVVDVEKDFGCVEWRQRGKVGFWRVKDCNRERKKNGLTGFNSIMCLYLISETSLRPKKTSLKFYRIGVCPSSGHQQALSG